MRYTVPNLIFDTKISLERSSKWTERSLNAYKSEKDTVFLYSARRNVQDLRKSTEYLTDMDFDGYA